MLTWRQQITKTDCLCVSRSDPARRSGWAAWQQAGPHQTSSGARRESSPSSSRGCPWPTSTWRETAASRYGESIKCQIWLWVWVWLWCLQGAGAGELWPLHLQCGQWCRSCHVHLSRRGQQQQHPHLVPFQYLPGEWSPRPLLYLVKLTTTTGLIFSDTLRVWVVMKSNLNFPGLLPALSSQLNSAL